MADRKWVQIEDFPALPGEKMHELVARHREAMRGLVSPTGAKFRFRKSFDTGYRHDLAEKANDPAAYVTGPHSLQRLIEKRKRQGWIVGKPGSAADVDANAHKPGRDAQEAVDEAFEEAKQIPAND